MRAAVKLRVSDCIIRLIVPQATKRQHIGNQIDAAFIFAWAGLRKHAFLRFAYHFVVAVWRAKRQNPRLDYAHTRFPVADAADARCRFHNGNTAGRRALRYSPQDGNFKRPRTASSSAGIMKLHHCRLAAFILLCASVAHVTGATECGITDDELFRQLKSAKDWPAIYAVFKRNLPACADDGISQRHRE